ncbi:hypothetical protein CspeluHIS016_0100130 [Cutaneotrichosporon spelunceum]|uniref:Uncharacterized protein n=1 Tax=Cutaneotrichosporon spelunceum TaxID=1672016 RepID=A0AAD3TN09_9TREE|nr:hypothetical protein CspeluHIS016_0100130 [Cutaneotrichosporon spelunceum]
MLAALVVAPVARAQDPTTTTVPTATPLPSYHPSSSNGYWTNSRTSDILLYISLLLLAALLVYYFYYYTKKQKKKRAAAPAQWEAVYGNDTLGSGRAGGRNRGSGYVAVSAQHYGPYPYPPGHDYTPAYAEYEYPPPPVYVQSYSAPPHVPKDAPKDGPAPLSRASSPTSASTLIGSGDKNASQLGEGEDDTLERPQPAHKSAWRGRFARLGDRS